LEMGATILSMNLAHGGHLTHGSPVNFSGKYFRVVPYGVRESDGRIDTEQVRDLARRERPKMIVVGHSAYPRAIDFAPFRTIADKAVALHEAATPAFRDYQRQIVANAKALAAGLLRRGSRLLSGGTDNHLMMLDLRGTELTGKLAEETLDKARITVNKNAVPNDPRSPFVTSGVRLGTPAVTSRGMKEAEMETIAELVRRGLERVGDDAALGRLGEEVRELCRRFPIYR